MEKNKKQILILGIIAIVIIAGLIIFFVSKNNSEIKENSSIEKIETLDISEVIEVDNLDKFEYEKIQNDERKIASKYIVDDEIYELKANVELTEILGKMIYVREDYEKLNIYQTEYKLDKYEDVNSQIDEIIRKFEDIVKRYLGIELEEAKDEQLYGEASQKEEIPLGESIYFDNRLYSKTYEKEEKIYDINFYRNEEKIICEFVYDIEEQ